MSCSHVTACESGLLLQGGVVAECPFCMLVEVRATLNSVSASAQHDFDIMKGQLVAMRERAERAEAEARDLALRVEKGVPLPAQTVPELLKELHEQLGPFEIRFSVTERWMMAP